MAAPSPLAGTIALQQELLDPFVPPRSLHRRLSLRHSLSIQAPLPLSSLLLQELVLQILDVLLLFSHQGAIGAIPDADLEGKGVVLDVLLDCELVEGLELVVAPALTDLEGRAVLSLDRQLGVQGVQQLDPVLVFVLTDQTFRHLHKHRNVLVSCQTVSMRVDLQPPLDPVEVVGLRVYDTVSG